MLEMGDCYLADLRISWGVLVPINQHMRSFTVILSEISKSYIRSILEDIAIDDGEKQNFHFLFRNLIERN